MPSELPPHSGRHTARGHGQPVIPYVSCDAHGKNAYHTRKDARAVVKMERRAGKRDAEAYPCDALEGKWHVGGGHRMRDARRGFGT